MKRIALNLIEPTLQNQSGHCFGYVSSLLSVRAPENFSWRLWIGKSGGSLFDDNVDCVPYFYYRVRKLQQLYLYRKLLKQEGALFIPTATRFDLKLLARLTQHDKKTKVFLHFHQFRVSDSKRSELEAMAHQNQNWVILAPTQKLLNVFQAAGFEHCEVVPCPTYLETWKVTPQTGSPEVKLIYSGAARADKGFHHVVDLIARCHATEDNIPISIQTSSPHSGRYDAASTNAIAKLQQIPYAHLTTLSDTLSMADYTNQFNQAIVLLLYDNLAYGDKFSGVALDAYRKGCPVITTKNTWIAEMCERFQAGIVVNDTDPHTVQQAAHQIQKRYSAFQANARHAGAILEQEHDPVHTLQVIERYLEPMKIIGK